MEAPPFFPEEIWREVFSHLGLLIFGAVRLLLYVSTSIRLRETITEVRFAVQFRYADIFLPF